MQHRPGADQPAAAAAIWLHAAQEKVRRETMPTKAKTCKKQQNCPSDAAVEMLPCSCPAPAKSLPQLPTTCGKLQQRGLRAVDCFGGAGGKRVEVRWCVNAGMCMGVCV